MCTVSIVPHARGYRLMCNRDEQRARQAAIPPSIKRAGERVAAFPVDPVGGGTWVGVNDTGLSIALLNRYTGRGATGLRHSRGVIVRALLAQPSLSDARRAALALDASVFDPFEIVLVQHSEWAAITSNGRTLTATCAELTVPVLFTSSSLGDTVVQAPRKQLFSRLVLDDDETALHGQARFHRHQWRTRPEISVRMARPEAATVSRTTIDATQSGHRLMYQTLEGALEGSRQCCFFR